MNKTLLLTWIASGSFSLMFWTGMVLTLSKLLK